MTLDPKTLAVARFRPARPPKYRAGLKPSREVAAALIKLAKAARLSAEASRCFSEAAEVLGAFADETDSHAGASHFPKAPLPAWGLEIVPRGAVPYVPEDGNGTEGRRVVRVVAKEKP